MNQFIPYNYNLKTFCFSRVEFTDLKFLPLKKRNATNSTNAGIVSFLITAALPSNGQLELNLDQVRL